MTTPSALASAPTLPGMLDGIIARDENGWTIVCRDCGATSTDRSLLLAIRDKEMRFHAGGWPGADNRRLCRDCRLARGCQCHSCEAERRSA